jgi:HK97 family phage portal protein
MPLSDRLSGEESPMTEYVRATQSIKLNDPDGWMSTNGPVWWLSPDQPTVPDWRSYGWPYNGGPIGRRNEWGGSAVDPRYLQGRGILPSITRATNIIVGPTIRTTWRYMKGTNTDISDLRQGTDMISRPLWIADPQLLGTIPGGDGARPTLPFPKRMGAHTFWRTALTHALWWGTGAIIYTEDAFGQPLAGTLRIVNPCMWGYTDDGRFILDSDGEDPIESDHDGYFDVGVFRWRMVTLRGYPPNDGSTAEGALTRSGLVTLAGERMNSYLASILNTGVPAGVLKVGVPNYDETDATALKKSWMDAHGGTEKSVAVLNAGVDFTPLQLNVVDSDVVAAKGDWRVDMAHAFNLSAAWLDASTSGSGSITYANISDRRRDLLDHTLADWGRGLEDLITALLPYGVKMRIDWSGYLNTDPAQDMAFVKQGLDLGYLTKEEARDRLGLPPLTPAQWAELEPAPVPEQLIPGGQNDNTDGDPAPGGSGAENSGRGDGTGL